MIDNDLINLKSRHFSRQFACKKRIIWIKNLQKKYEKLTLFDQSYEEKGNGTRPFKLNHQGILG